MENNDLELELNQEQNLVLQLALQGQSIFLTGSAGTEKSFLLKINKNRTHTKSKIGKK